MTENFWKILSGVLVFVLLLQYGFYGIKETMYTDTIIVHRKNVDEIQQLKTAVLKLSQEIDELHSKDKQLTERITSNKLMIDRDLEQIKDANYKPIRKLNK